MPGITSTSRRLHSEFVLLLFLQAHRETDRFFAAAGVQLAQHNCVSSTTTARRSPPSSNPRLGTFTSFSLRLSITDHIEYRRRTFSVKITHSPITLANLSSIDLVSLFRCCSPPRNTLYARRLSALAFSLSSHRHSHISLLLRSRFIVS
jgi:hypothetical protein